MPAMRLVRPGPRGVRRRAARSGTCSTRPPSPGSPPGSTRPRARPALSRRGARRAGDRTRAAQPRRPGVDQAFALRWSDVDTEALAAAVDDVVARHEPLRDPALFRARWDGSALRADDALPRGRRVVGGAAAPRPAHGVRGPARPGTRRTGRSCRSPTRTTRRGPRELRSTRTASGSCAYWRAPRWPACPRWRCRWTGRARPPTRRRFAGFALDAGAARGGSTSWPGRPARACSWSCRPRSPGCSPAAARARTCRSARSWPAGRTTAAAPTSSAASSTPSCCAPTRRASRTSARCWPGSASPTWTISDHQDVPLADLLGRRGRRSCWCTTSGPSSTPAIAAIPVGTTAADLTLAFYEPPGDGPVACYLHYRTDLFDRATVEALGRELRGHPGVGGMR